MIYDPSKRDSRELLAVALIQKLDECGFVREPRPKTDEAVYSRPVDQTGEKIRVLVYSSVVPSVHGFDIRGNGDDSIKVVAIYMGRNNKERGLVKVARVHRVGEISAIVERMYARMRDVYKKAQTGARCSKCGAPMFTSKAGNLVCADLCWLSDEEYNRPNPNAHSHRNWGYGRRFRRSA